MGLVKAYSVSRDASYSHRVLPWVGSNAVIPSLPITIGPAEPAMTRSTPTMSLTQPALLSIVVGMVGVLCGVAEVLCAKGVMR